MCLCVSNGVPTKKNAVDRAMISGGFDPSDLRADILCLLVSSDGVSSLLSVLLFVFDLCARASRRLYRLDGCVSPNGCFNGKRIVRARVKVFCLDGWVME